MAAPDFRRQKWSRVLWILGAGMAAGVAWSLFASWVLGEGYPKGYLLGAPAYRFSDFTDATLVAPLPNPYVDPVAIYPPLVYVILRALPFSDSALLSCLDFFSVVALALLLFRVLATVIADAWARVAFAFLFLALSYPLIFCLDRGNIDIIVFPFVGWALYCYLRRRELMGTACLFPVICLKLYPALFLFLLVRRGKTGLAVACGLGALAVNAACLCLFQQPPATIWESYRQNSAFVHDYYFLDTNGFDGSASLWNAYKISLVLLHKIGLISPVNFGFDSSFMIGSYQFYVAGFALYTLLILGYAIGHERSFVRSVILLFLLVSLSFPLGSDYRLVYVSMTLVLLVLLRNRPGDMTALILLALAVIPKTEIFLNTMGKESLTDVPIQSLLNSPLIFAAMLILLYHARRPFDWRKAALRLRVLLPWRWRWI